MEQQQSDAVIVRQLEHDSEINELITLMTLQFQPDADITTALPRRRRFLQEGPTSDPSQLRGAFHGTNCLGGYVIEERTLHSGPARLATGCIGTVVTHTNHRMKKVGTALLRDAVRYGQTRHHALLLLNGIPDFYHRFGFTDVLDITTHHIERSAVLALPPSPYTVRQSTTDDISTLLSLYQQHYSRYTGSFTRTLRQQQHIYHYRYRMTPVLALSPSGEPCGYLLLGQRNGLITYEVAANNWPAALALLQYYAHQLAEQGNLDETLQWPLPPDSTTLYTLANHLFLQSTTHIRPYSGWMARVAHLPTLIHALLPLWQEHWHHSARPWSGTLALTIEQSTWLLALRGDRLQLVEQPTGQVQQVTLNQQALVQLVFGYRPVEWIMQQPTISVPEEIVPVLSILFPLHHAWIAGSDAF